MNKNDLYHIIVPPEQQLEQATTLKNSLCLQLYNAGYRRVLYLSYQGDLFASTIALFDFNEGNVYFPRVNSFTPFCKDNQGRIDLKKRENTFKYIRFRILNTLESMPIILQRQKNKEGKDIVILGIVDSQGQIRQGRRLLKIEDGCIILYKNITLPVSLPFVTKNKTLRYKRV